MKNKLKMPKKLKKKEMPKEIGYSKMNQKEIVKIIIKFYWVLF